MLRLCMKLSKTEAPLLQTDQPKCTKGFRAHKLDQKDDQRLGGRVGEERQEKEEKRN